MDGGCLTELDLRRYKANLAALEESQPELAGRLKTLDIPSSVQRVTGRDRSDAFRIQRSDGSWFWFGRSSMPTVSAPALVGGFQPDGRNVILPVMGTGREALLVAERLPPHCAVFVFERELLYVKLALCVCDWSDLIRRRRVVLLCGDDVETVLADFFSACPGFEFPQHMIPLSLLSSGEQDRMKLRLESAGRQVAAIQWTAANQLAAELRDLPAAAPGDRPRVLLSSRDPRREALGAVAQLTATLEHLGCPVASSVPDRPDKAHAASRLAAIRRHEPDLVLLLNCLKGSLQQHLPQSLATVSWFITPDSVESALAEDLGGHRAIFAAHPAMIDRLIEAGAPADNVHLLEHAADPLTFAPAEVEEAAGQRWNCQAAVLADGADLSPGAANITLSSHIRLWESVRDLTAKALGSWCDASVSQTLERAGSKSGVRLDDDEVRRQFGEVIRCRLVPTLQARRAVESLAGQGLEAGLWGDGWETHTSVSGLVRGAIPDAAGRNLIFNSAPVVVLPVFRDDTARIVLECLAAGSCPVIRTPERPLADLHPQLCEVLSTVPGAASPREMASLAKELVADADRRAAIVQTGRRLALERHTLEHRVRRALACIGR